MWQDPIVAEVRRIREEYAACYNHDLHAICEAMREREKASGGEVVSLPPRRPKGFSDAQDESTR